MNTNIIQNEDKVLSLAYPEEYKELLNYRPQDLYQMGPVISKYILPKTILKKMTNISEDILKSKDKKRWGYHLAGQIDSEYLIPEDILIKENLLDYFKLIVKCYLRDYMDRSHYTNVNTKVLQLEVDLNSMWIVEQFKHEHNPVHWHENCSISSVMYLKTPRMKNNGNIPGKKDQAGNITFINRSTNPGQSFELPLFSLKPKKGDIYIFPSSMAHTVYPFDNDVRRLSVSFNADNHTNVKFLS